MFLTETTNKKLIKSIINDPILWKELDGVGDREYIHNNEWTYYLFTHEGKVIGLIPVKEYTKVTLDCHIFLLPQYWGKNYSDAMIDLFIRFLELHSNYSQLMASVPKVCSVVIKMLERNEFKLFGTLKNGIIYNHEHTDLLMFNKEIR